MYAIMGKLQCHDWKGMRYVQIYKKSRVQESLDI